MKISINSVIKLIIISSLIFAAIPSNTRFASAENRSQSDSHISFDLITSSDQGMELVLSAPSYQISKIQFQDQLFDHVTVPGAVVNSAPGELQLPAASKLVAVPPQAEVKLEIISDSKQRLPGNYYPATSPHPARLDETNPAQRWDFTEDEQIQPLNSPQKNIQYPVRIADEAWIRDQRVIRLEYSPFLYDANTDTLNWYPSVTVKIHFDYPFSEPASSQFFQQSNRRDTPFDTALSNTLLNSEQAAGWRTNTLPTEVLVTPPKTGARYRIAIKEDGIYKLTYADLLSVNPAITTMVLAKLHMTSQGQDVAIYIHDHDINDGDSLNPGDYIVFYGQRFYGDRLAKLYQSENQNWYTFTSQNTDGTYFSWKPQFNEIMLEKYTDENIYWLFEGATDGLRMGTESGDPSENSNPPVESYRETIRAEESNIWKTTLFTGEDTWFWKRLYYTDDLRYLNKLIEFPTELTAVAATGPDAIMRAEFVSAVGNSNDNEDHHTKIYFNSEIVGPTDGFKWSGKSRYSFEGTLQADINEGANNFGIEVLTDTEFSYPDYYIDWFEIEYNRNFKAVDNAISFTSPVTGLQKFQVENFSNTDDIIVLDITDPVSPIYVTGTLTNTAQATISLDRNSLSIAMDAGGKSISPSQISYYQPPNWGAMTAGADYVIITHTDLITTAQTMANYRAGTGLSTVVVDINDLYNEFNFGIFHPIAVKNFLSYTFENWETIPSYALLVGDGHWNFHEYNPDYYGAGPQLIIPNLVWVDPWQGEVDSANLLATIVGDDPLADLMIARLPVNNNAELNAYIDKLIAYETAPYGNWMQNHVFVADDPDSAGDFTIFAENVVSEYIDPFANATATEVYQEDYGCINDPSPECDNAKSALLEGLNSGALILNYIGHASVRWWSHELIFTPDDFSALPNTNKLPVILSMTCLDGYWSGPIKNPGSSMIEELVRREASGAIASFSPTGLGISSGHDILHKGFYDALMNDGIQELGSAVQNSKLWLYQTGMNQDLLHTYTIFGDPALQIRIPTMLFLPLTTK